jgi:hypothetical protein
MTEVTIPITRNGEYNNVTLKPKWDKVKKTWIKGIMPGEYATFTKVFEKGMEMPARFTNKDGSPKLSYSIRIKDSNGEEVSTFLQQAEHEDFVALGPVGAKFSAMTTKETYIDARTGNEVSYFKLHLTETD